MHVRDIQSFRSFRDALVPCQKNVTIARFSSFESFRQRNFIGMEYFSGGESSLMTHEIDCAIASDRESYPNNLSKAYLCYCRSITPRKEVRFENVMGPRLEKLM
mmetsp:Transcript_6688/g.12247  ORF Transcript_6688/g.12247 Transcript_6688/m.12247 type:complete len:104 (+) Transcript_6688:686-997(+)